MLEIIERLLNRINTRGLKLIFILTNIGYWIFINTLFIRAFYDRNSTFLGVNILVCINMFYFLAFADHGYFLKNYKKPTPQIAINQILGFLESAENFV